MARILVVEDNEGFRDALAETLEDEGYDVQTAPDGSQGLEAFARRRPDLVLLDVMMPGRDGFDVCAEMRAKEPLVPILMLTAKNAENDRVRGLKRGADDYIDKTVGTRELLARIAAALRRGEAIAARAAPPPKADAAADLGESFMVGSHRVDGRRFRLIDARGRVTDITPREIKILRLLVAGGGAAVGREDIISHLWDGEYAGTTRSIDQSIWRLREKLGTDGQWLVTVHGAGYAYRPRHS